MEVFNLLNEEGIVELENTHLTPHCLSASFPFLYCPTSEILGEGEGGIYTLVSTSSLILIIIFSTCSRQTSTPRYVMVNTHVRVTNDLHGVTFNSCFSTFFLQHSSFDFHSPILSSFPHISPTILSQSTLLAIYSLPDL